MDTGTRKFVQGCASIFIWLGALGFAVSLLAGIATLATGMYILAVAPVLIGVIGSATIVLVGGSTYVVCSIDARLQALTPEPDVIEHLLRGR